MRSAVRAILSAGGVGFVPGPAGTWGSLVTVLVVVAVDGLGPPAGSLAALVAAAFGIVATWTLGGRVGSDDGHGDPSWVVTDEVAGQAIALSLAGLAPARGLATTLAAFVLFRVLDITKPGPIRSLERIPGGLGILLDDVLAGVVAGALAAGLGVFLG